MSLWHLRWRKCGKTRRAGKRSMARTRAYLRRYGYVTEYSLQLWRLRRRREGDGR